MITAVLPRSHFNVLCAFALYQLYFYPMLSNDINNIEIVLNAIVWEHGWRRVFIMRLREPCLRFLI